MRSARSEADHRAEETDGEVRDHRAEDAAKPKKTGCAATITGGAPGQGRASSPATGGSRAIRKQETRLQRGHGKLRERRQRKTSLRTVKRDGKLYGGR